MHVHPTSKPGDPEMSFGATCRYRLLLQFQVDGEVKTAAFSQELK